VGLLSASLVSHLFWPEAPEAELQLPAPIEAAMSEFHYFMDTQRLRITVSNMRNANTSEELERIKAQVGRGGAGARRGLGAAGAGAGAGLWLLWRGRWAGGLAGEAGLGSGNAGNAAQCPLCQHYCGPTQRRGCR
jgi:hypothetical protein